MGKRVIVPLLVIAAICLIAPATAFGGLVNEYGMHYAGQDACTSAGCHAGYDNQLHARFSTPGLNPEPEAWTAFHAAGNVAEQAGAEGALYDAGGTYPTSLPWVTLGDVETGSPTEYLFWKGTNDPTVMPWNLVEGLVYEPDTGEWAIAAETPAKGLYDVSYSCQRCHQLGSTAPNVGYVKGSTGTEVVPNPAATKAASSTTAVQWAREDGTTVDQFMSDPDVSYPGMGIQCENCHGTGQSNEIGHPGRIGVDVNISLDTLGPSSGCGQCHGSYTNVPGTLGIYGYTPNLPMREFVDINGLSGGVSYTKIPTEAEFAASPKAYFMYPNGSNAKGNHYYYNEWSASAHSYRGALTATSDDAMAYQAAGNGHYAAATSPLGCANCHTGEAYLKSKDAKIVERWTPTSDSVGMMGQECVTCHLPHPADFGGESLREPDQAGERSATGLSTSNQSICEDCHNWQYEVLGGAPEYKPLSSISSRGGASHPQRESLHGRVMVDVAQAGEFMPGAKCEDCHNPKTNKSANRVSHGMKIMMPGDAERWQGMAGYTMGEDSCSGCHPSRSRDQLQTTIDTWQEDTAALADEAAAAITAAQASGASEYSLTDATAPGYKLVGRATWNYKAYVNDLSGGVHNPEYIQEGLAEAVMMAKSVGGSFAVVQAPASLVPGKSGLVSGKVVNGDGSAAAGATLRLGGNTTTADAKGGFTFLVTPSGTTTYRVVWVRSGDSATDLTSASVKIAAAKIASSATAKASATSIRYGARVKLSGKVRPAAAGRTVKLMARKGSGSWRTIKTVKLNSSSNYAYRYKPTARATWSFKARYAGTSSVRGSTSRVVKVRVR